LGCGYGIIKEKEGIMPLRATNLVCYWIISIFIASTLVACGTAGLNAIEQEIPPDQRLALQEGGPHAGEIDTGFVAIAYEYTCLPEDQMTKKVMVKGSILSVPAESDTVNIYLLAVDGQGNAFAREILFASGHGSYGIRKGDFEESVQFSQEAMAIAFDAYVQDTRGER
jgi:hypothetical protein